MKSHLTVLISSAGRRVELVNCFQSDARDLGLGLRVLATDCNPRMSAACHVADQALMVPRCTEPAFIPRLREICAVEQVDLVVPTIDTELMPLAEARETFESAGTRIAISDTETVAIARDKLRTAAFLEQHGIPSPRSVPMAHLLHDPRALRFPVILKRLDGSSSIGVREVERMDDIGGARIDATHYIAQEKWMGREYTVNMFFDTTGCCRMVVPHWRAEVRGGEVSQGVTVRHPLLLDFAAQLAAVLPGARGALCFQAIVAADETGVMFEINARFGGGYPLTHHAGARFCRALLEEAAGLPRSANGSWEEGVTMLRYDAAVFVPRGAGLK